MFQILKDQYVRIPARSNAADLVVQPEINRWVKGYHSVRIERVYALPKGNPDEMVCEAEFLMKLGHGAVHGEHEATRRDADLYYRSEKKPQVTP